MRSYWHEWRQYDMNTVHAGSLPHAYQMILSLMNYERTVADFGRCEGSVRLQVCIVVR